MHVFGWWEEAGVPGENAMHMGRTCKLHTERPQLRVEPGTLLPWGNGANHHTTVQPSIKFTLSYLVLYIFSIFWHYSIWLMQWHPLWQPLWQPANQKMRRRGKMTKRQSCDDGKPVSWVLRRLPVLDTQRDGSKLLQLLNDKAWRGIFLFFLFLFWI